MDRLVFAWWCPLTVFQLFTECQGRACKLSLVSLSGDQRTQEAVQLIVMAVGYILRALPVQYPGEQAPLRLTVSQDALGRPVVDKAPLCLGHS